MWKNPIDGTETNVEMLLDTRQRVTFTYLNYRGEKSTRIAEPRSIRYGTSPYHKDAQWLMTAFDVEKAQIREFAMKDMWGVNAHI